MSHAENIDQHNQTKRPSMKKNAKTKTKQSASKSISDFQGHYDLDGVSYQDDIVYVGSCQPIRVLKVS